MSVHSEIRDIANRCFEPINRDKCIAFGVSLALGLHYGNKENNDSNVENKYISNYYQPISETISILAEEVLFDVRYSLELTKQIYKLLTNIRNKKVIIKPNNDDLLKAMFDLDNYLKEEELHLFKENNKGIFDIYNVITYQLLEPDLVRG